MNIVSTKPGTQRIILLDVYRVIAALAVVLFHLAYRGNLTDRFCDVGFGSFGEIFQHGYLGVDFFFMISGFVISFSAVQGSAGKFAYSRALRLFPAFVICCTITYLTTLLFDDGRLTLSFWQYLLNLSMLSGFVGVPFVDGVYWSLLVEIQFYCMVSALLWMNGRRHLESCIRLWLFASIALYFVHIRGANRIVLSEYAPLFCAGATFYYCYAQKVTFSRVVTLIASYLASIGWATTKGMNLTEYYHREFDFRITIAIEACFFLAFVLVLLRVQPRWPRFWIVAGTATYPLYLLHQNIGFVLINRLYTYIYGYVALAIVFGVLIGMTLLISEYLEPKARRAMQRRLDRLSINLNMPNGFRNIGLPNLFPNWMLAWRKQP